MFTDIRLQHFRSYGDASFEFSPGVNIIVGPNASGKTNLLEALLVLSRGSSYRAKDADLVEFDQPWGRLEAHDTANHSRTCKLAGSPAVKTYELDGKVYKRLGVNQTLPVVLFEPNHLQLLGGAPELRRAYLDDLLEQTTAGYGSLRRQYRRTLAQRNALLKHGGRADMELFPWNLRLSQLGGQIVRERSALAGRLDQTIPKLYKDISNASTIVSLQYASRWAADGYESHLLKKLEADTETDRQRGFTGAGPHREDLVVEFDGHPAAEAASRGETRTLVLALKALELQILQAARGTTPLLLLDDVFSELDGRRRHALTSHLQPYQTFITTTDADVAVQNFAQAHSIALV